jgi:hypothetical protein
MSNVTKALCFATVGALAMACVAPDVEDAAKDESKYEIYLPHVSSSTQRQQVFGGEALVRRLKERGGAGIPNDIPNNIPASTDQPNDWCTLTTNAAMAGMAATAAAASVTALCAGGMLLVTAGTGVPVCVVPAGTTTVVGLYSVAMLTTSFITCVFADQPSIEYVAPVNEIEITSGGAVAARIDTERTVLLQTEDATVTNPTTERLKCSESTLARIYKGQRKWCDGQGTLSCADIQGSPTDLRPHCAELQRRGTAASFCIDHRSAVNNCFKDDLGDHATPIAHMKKIAQECFQKYAFAGCAEGPFSQ